VFDLIGALTSDVSVHPSQAKAIAGRFLAYLTSAVADRFGDGAAEELEAHLPHAEEWQATEPFIVPGLPPPAEATNRTDAQLSGILGHLGIDPVKAGLALPPLVAYLKSNLPPSLLMQVFAVAPFLTGVAPEYHPNGLSAPMSTF